MIGIDIVEIGRIEELISDENFLRRVYTDAELLYCRQAKSTRVIASRLAARFAAKEAVFKAIESLKVLHWKEIEIINDKRGKPVLYFYGETKKRLNKLSIKVDISISHSEDYAVSVAIIVA